MLLDILYKIGQILLVIAILTFVLYRLALLMDWLPNDFSPSGMVKEEYKSFKEELKTESALPDMRGQISTIMLRNINRFEKYIDDKQKQKQAQDKLEAKCQENSIFRWFMFLGDNTGGNKGCMEQNMNLKHADEELRNEANPKAKPAGGQQPNQPANQLPTNQQNQPAAQLPNQSSQPAEQNNQLKKLQQQILDAQQKQVDNQLKQIDQQVHPTN